jgi:hypothetical protein
MLCQKTLEESLSKDKSEGGGADFVTKSRFALLLLFAWSAEFGGAARLRPLATLPGQQIPVEISTAAFIRRLIN